MPKAQNRKVKGKFMNLKLGYLALLLPLVSQHAYGAEPPHLILTTELAPLREQLGKSLIDAVVTLNNEQNWVLARVTPQGASFAFNNEKEAGETFDQLRKRSYFAVSFTTCSGAKSLDAKISSIIAWQTVIPNGNSGNYQSYTAAYLQELLETINTPAAITNPSTVRAPRGDQLRGVVFEYVKGDTTETLSLTDDLGMPTASALRFSWQAVNTSFCPKT